MSHKEWFINRMREMLEREWAKPEIRSYFTRTYGDEGWQRFVDTHYDSYVNPYHSEG